MPSGSDEREDKLMGAMMGYLMQGKEGVCFKTLSNDLEFMERTKSWRASWKSLIEDKEFVAPTEGSTAMFGKDEYQLTQAGKDHASTPEYKECLKELNFVPQTNEEHQERIKKRLINDKAKQMFDLLLKYGNLTRKELSTIIGVNDRGHSFSYGLKNLKEKGIVVEDAKGSGKGKKLLLADKAFLKREDRPVPVMIDSSILKAGAEKIKSRKKNSSGKDGDSEKKPKGKRKAKSEDKEADEEEETISPPKKKIASIKYEMVPRKEKTSDDEGEEEETTKRSRRTKQTACKSTNSKAPPKQRTTRKNETSEEEGLEEGEIVSKEEAIKNDDDANSGDIEI